MRVLDIDMDFFLDSVPTFISSNCADRLNENDYIPWSQENVVSYFENNLGLSTKKKTEGKIITHHHEALYYWRNLIARNKLKIPFDIIHIDSHADLGLGYSSWTFIFEKLLALPVVERSKIEDYQKYFETFYKPDIGDYLLFALAFRWINSISYVPNASKDGHDYLLYIFKDCVEANDKIQLPYNNIMQATELNEIEKRKSYLSSSILEPEVSFEIVEQSNIRITEGFDFLTFCISPNYTPQTADFIIDIANNYIC